VTRVLKAPYYLQHLRGCGGSNKTVKMVFLAMHPENGKKKHRENYTVI
jgi:hypothetical protein